MIVIHWKWNVNWICWNLPKFKIKKFKILNIFKSLNLLFLSWPAFLLEPDLWLSFLVLCGLVIKTVLTSHKWLIMPTWRCWGRGSPRPGGWWSPWSWWGAASTAWSSSPGTRSCCPGPPATAGDTRGRSWWPGAHRTREGWPWSGRIWE